MSISSIKATFGLDGVGTGTRPLVAQTAIVGQTSAQVPLATSTIVFAAKLYLQQIGDVGSVDGTDLTTAIDVHAATSASVTINPTGADNSVAYTADTSGTGGNSISVAYVISGTGSTVLSVVTTGTAIVVTAGSACIASAVITAVNADPTASALVTASASGAVTGVIAAVAATSLVGGYVANAWTGDTEDFQGDALPAPSAISGLHVYCSTGAATITVGATTLIPLATGERVQKALTSGISDLLGLISFEATAVDTTIYIVLTAVP
jgi:hypothetical protein